MRFLKEKFVGDTHQKKKKKTVEEKKGKEKKSTGKGREREFRITNFVEVSGRKIPQLRGKSTRGSN